MTTYTMTQNVTQVTERPKTISPMFQLAAPAQPAGFTLENLLDRLPRVPSQTAVLGMCRDGLPVLMDLQDERTGAILAISQSSESSRALLQTALLTALALNSPREVQAVVLTHQRESWVRLFGEPGSSRYLFGLADASEHNVGEWLNRLAGTVEARYAGKQQGPAILLILDGLDVMSSEGSAAMRQLDWLLAEGPAMRVWTFAGLTLPASVRFNRLIGAFGTHLVGKCNTYEDLGRLTDTEGIDASALVSGKSFAVKTGLDWLVFDLPVIE